MSVLTWALVWALVSVAVSVFIGAFLAHGRHESETLDLELDLHQNPTEPPEAAASNSPVEAADLT